MYNRSYEPCRRAVSVRPSVRLSRSCILSKRINISSIFHHRRQPRHSSFFYIPDVIAITIATGTANWGKIAIFDQYLMVLASVTAGPSCVVHVLS